MPQAKRRADKARRSDLASKSPIVSAYIREAGRARKDAPTSTSLKLKFQVPTSTLDSDLPAHTLALASPHLQKIDLGHKTHDQLAEVRTRPVSL